MGNSAQVGWDWGGNLPLYLQGHNCLVVDGPRLNLVPYQAAHDRLHGTARFTRPIVEGPFDTVCTEQFAFGVFGLGDPIGVEDQYLSRGQLQRRAGVGGRLS